MLRLTGFLSGSRTRATSKEHVEDVRQGLRQASPKRSNDASGAFSNSVASDAPVPKVGICYLAKDEFPKVINLDVGGKEYMTTLMTLRSRQHSHLAELFSGELPVRRDADGTFLIDRDGSDFHHILNFLRDGSVPIGLMHVQRLNLLRESKFYGLDALYSILGGVQEPHEHKDTLVSLRARSHLKSMHGAGRVQSDKEQNALREEFDFVPSQRKVRIYARLRHGHEYPGDWIVSSPRNLPNVQYEAHEATLSRDLIPAMDKMVSAGFRPCSNPPKLPKPTEYHTEGWQLMMFRDVPVSTGLTGQEVLNMAIGNILGGSANSVNSVSSNKSVCLSRGSTGML